MRRLFHLFLLLAGLTVGLASLDYVVIRDDRARPLRGAAYQQVYRESLRRDAILAQHEPVSLVSLLANPKAYDGKRVLAAGYACFEHEHLAVYLDKSAMEAGLQQNGVWVNPPRWFDRKTWPRYSRRYVKIAGVFNAHDHSYGAYRGALDDVRWLDHVMSMKDFRQWRVREWRRALLSTTVRVAALATLAALAAMAALGFWRLLGRLLRGLRPN